jgi:hypothetical protein
MQGISFFIPRPNYCHYIPQSIHFWARMDPMNDSRAISRQFTRTSINWWRHLCLFDTARSPARGKKLSEKLKMLPKFTGLENKFLHTYCKHHKKIARYILFQHLMKKGGHRCFFSATGNKMGAYRIFRLRISSNIDPPMSWATSSLNELGENLVSHPRGKGRLLQTR